jgi:hypothetical protein
MPVLLIGFSPSGGLQEIGRRAQIQSAANSGAVFMMSTRDQHEPLRLICRGKEMLAHEEGHDLVSRAMNEEDWNVDVGNFVNRIKVLSRQ